MKRYRTSFEIKREFPGRVDSNVITRILAALPEDPQLRNKFFQDRFKENACIELSLVKLNQQIQKIKIENSSANSPSIQLSIEKKDSRGSYWRKVKLSDFQTRLIFGLPLAAGSHSDIDDFNLMKSQAKFVITKTGLKKVYSKTDPKGFQASIQKHRKLLSKLSSPKSSD